jgi:hypothetical protein
MEKILYLNTMDVGKLVLNGVEKRYLIHTTPSLKEALIYLIDNPEVSMFVCDMDAENRICRKMIENLKHLNPILPIMLLNPGRSKISETELRQFNNNISIVNTLEQVKENIDNAMMNRRQFNRIIWPLSANFYTEKDIKYVETGLVLSLSAGGAFVKTTHFDIAKENLNRKIILEIKFEDFKFLVESIVLRVNEHSTGEMPAGFAAKFINISTATHSYIKRIVNDKILSSLMKVLNLLEEESVGN